MRDTFPRPWNGSNRSSGFLIHLIIFNILMPWNMWTGKALSSKFNFRDDPPSISKVGINKLWQLSEAKKYQFCLNLEAQCLLRNFNLEFLYLQESIESSLQIIHDISTENIGTLCISKLYSPLKIPIYNTERYDGARQKSDLASVVLQDLGFNRHSGESNSLRFQVQMFAYCYHQIS